MGIWSFWKFGLVYQSVSAAFAGLAGNFIKYFVRYRPAVSKPYDMWGHRRGSRFILFSNRYFSWFSKKYSFVQYFNNALRSFYNGYFSMGKNKKYFCFRENRAISPICFSSRNLDYFSIKKLFTYKAAASYTVEAAAVMSLVLLVLCTLIQNAYRIHDETCGAMALQQRVEKLRHQEKGDRINIEREQRVSRLLSKEWRLETSVNRNTVKGEIQNNGWSIKLETEIYDPENFMRMISIFDNGEKKDGN